MTEKTAAWMTAGLGAVVVGAFFLPFLDVGGLVTASGWDLVTCKQGDLAVRVAIGAVPVFGLVMLGVGVSGSRRAPLLALFFAVAVFLYLLYKLIQVFVATTGVGLWLVLGAAVAGVVVAAFSARDPDAGRAVRRGR